MSVALYSLAGKEEGRMTLPEAVFGQRINKKLLAQAVRVYLANKRQGTASTKTRGEVDGSTRKIYAQKGTGRARHGSIRAPIFVKGGIVFGPRPRDFSLDMPQKMRKKALFSALSAKFQDKSITVVLGLEKVLPKTREFGLLLKNLGLNSKKQKTLVIGATELEDLKRASRNIPGIHFVSAPRLNALVVLDTKQIILDKEAVLALATLTPGDKGKRKEKASA